jgi:hypothetical protein
LPLPDDGRPIVDWENRDAAWRNVAVGVRRAVLAGVRVGGGAPVDAGGTAATAPALPPGDPAEATRVLVLFADADRGLFDELRSHLEPLVRAGQIVVTNVDAALDPTLDERRLMTEADLVLPLISADFIAARSLGYAILEYARDLEDQSKTRVWPILLRPVDLHGFPLHTAPMLPEGGVPVTMTQPSRDAAWTSIAESVRAGRHAGGRRSVSETAKREPEEERLSPVRLVVVYAPEDAKWQMQLEKHLAPLLHDGRVQLRAWRTDQFDHSPPLQGDLDVIVLLVTADLLASSDQFWDVELPRMYLGALNGHFALYMVRLRPCDFGGTFLDRVPVLPANSAWISSFSDLDQAWVSVVSALRTAAGV